MASQRRQQVNNTLIIERFQLNDGGIYKCRAVNPLGTVTALHIIELSENIVSHSVEISQPCFRFFLKY